MDEQQDEREPINFFCKGCGELTDIDDKCSECGKCPDCCAYDDECDGGEGE